MNRSIGMHPTAADFTASTSALSCAIPSTLQPHRYASGKLRLVISNFGERVQRTLARLPTGRLSAKSVPQAAPVAAMGDDDLMSQPHT
jgi:hypothetical protein